MPLDPDLARLLDQLQQPGAPTFETMTPDEARAAVKGMTGLMGPAHPGVTTDELSVPTRAGAVRALVHRPEGVHEPAVLVLVHGAGGRSATPISSPCRPGRSPVGRA
jgi:acetyl esterase